MMELYFYGVAEENVFMKKHVVLFIEFVISLTLTIYFSRQLYIAYGGTQMNGDMNGNTIAGWIGIIAAVITLITVIIQWFTVLRKDSANIKGIKQDTDKIQNNRTEEKNEHEKHEEKLKSYTTAIHSELHEGLRDISSEFRNISSFIDGEKAIRKNASSEKQDALNSIDVLRKFIEFSDADTKLKEKDVMITQLMKQNSILLQENMTLKEQLQQVNEQRHNIQEQMQSQEKTDYDLD